MVSYEYDFVDFCDSVEAVVSLCSIAVSGMFLIRRESKMTFRDFLEGSRILQVFLLIAFHVARHWHRLRL